MTGESRVKNPLGEEPRKWAKAIDKQMVLKPNEDEIGTLAVGVLTRGHQDCQCGNVLHDGLDADFVLRFMQVMMPLNTRVQHIIVAGHKIADARNSMMRMAIEAGSDYLFTVDDDMILEPWVLHHMYQQIKMHPDAGIIAGWSVSKTGVFREPFVYADDDLAGGAWFGICNAHDELTAKMRATEQKIQQGIKIGPDDFNGERDVPLYEIAAIGTGCMMINLKWAKKILDPPQERCKTHGLQYCPHCAGEYPWFHEGVEDCKEGQRTWGQDIWFCKEMRKAGGKILVDPMLFIPHKDVTTGVIYGPPVRRKVIKPSNVASIAKEKTDGGRKDTSGSESGVPLAASGACT